MVVIGKWSRRRDWVQDQGIPVGSGHGIAGPGCDALGGPHDQRSGTIVRSVGIDRQAGQKWRSATNYARRIVVWRSDKADIRPREDVVIVIVKVHAPQGF